MVMQRILSELNKIPGVVGSLVTGKDGLPIASAVPEDVNVDVVSAMAAAIIGTSERSTSEIGQGELEQVMIEGKNGKTLVMDVGNGVLVVLTTPDINLGLIRLDMKRAARDLREALEL